MNNIKSVRTPMLPELSDDNKSLLPLLLVQANNRSTRHRSTPMPGNKNPRHQLPRSSNATTIHLVPTDCVRETSSGISSAMDSKFTTRRNQLGAALAALNHLEDSLMVRRLQANVRVAAA
jgi:hypothetical protein